MALIHIAGKTYELIGENKNGWNLEVFRDRYSEVLERYDYVVGDWGYNQLRLKGFFRDTYTKGSKDSMYSTMGDYLSEYCNFGCAYFILEKKHGVRKEDIDASSEEVDAAYTEGLDGEDMQQDRTAAASEANSSGNASTTRQQQSNRNQRYKSRSGNASNHASSGANAQAGASETAAVKTGNTSMPQGFSDGEEEDFDHLVPGSGGGSRGGKHSRNSGSGRREQRRGSRGGTKKDQRQAPIANEAANEAAAASEEAVAPQQKRNRQDYKKRGNRS